MASLNQSAAAVCLRIVGEQEMAQLNHRYRQRAEPTNVLAFPGTLALEGEPALLGDLAVCSQVIQAESERYRLPFSNRYAHILIHGLLHLLGYDHQQEDARLAMESKERALLAALGMTDPYETT